MSTDPGHIRELAQAMKNKLDNGMGYQEAQRQVFKGLRCDERAAYISAVGHELSMRQHLKEARAFPDALPTEPISRPEPKQAGFSFGEGSRVKIRPPTRRHL